MFGKRKPNGDRSPERQQESGETQREPRLLAEERGAKRAPTAQPGKPAPRSAGAQPLQRPTPPIANPAANNPIAGITAPSRGAAHHGSGNGHTGSGNSESTSGAAKSAAGTTDGGAADTQRQGQEHRGQTPMTSGASEGKKLIVGRDIRLAGEITTCDTLVVEGHVECNLSDSKMLEIAESGVFKGKASVEVAEISGLFEGELTVTQHLRLHGSGQIKGTLRYREMEIARGGRLSGDIAEIEDAKAQTAGARPQPAEPVEQRVTPDSEVESQGRAAAGGGAN